MTILCAAHLEPMYVTRASEWSMDLYACTEVICTSETGTVRLCKGRHVSEVSEGIMVRDPAHPPRIHPPFEDVIRFKHDTVTHCQNALRLGQGKASASRH